jgi:transposase-like protein
MRSHQNIPFPPEVREAAVRRYLTTEVSYRRLAAEIGTSERSLRDWVKRHQAGQMKPPDEDLSRSTDERAPEEKLRLLLKARALADEQLGEFLRREGIREGDLERWEQEALGGLQRGPSDAGKSRQIRELERRVHKSEKRLKEANALLELQKKVQALWGDEDDNTPHS